MSNRARFISNASCNEFFSLHWTFLPAGRCTWLNNTVETSLLEGQDPEKLIPSEGRKSRRTNSRTSGRQECVFAWLEKFPKTKGGNSLLPTWLNWNFRVKSESYCVSPKGGDKDGFGEMQWSSVIMANEFLLPQERKRLLTWLVTSWCG